MVKSASDLVAAADAEVGHVSVDEARALHGDGDVVFLDVREPPEVAKGKVPGAVHVPRGLLEFAADPASPTHNPALSSGSQVVVYCGSGARSALAAKTLKDMGIERVTHMQGGFGGWKSAGNEVED